MGLVVGIEIDGDGAHPAAWRAADHPPDALLSPVRVGDIARRAEAAGFAFLTLDDRTSSGPVGSGVAGRLDPVTVAAFASATTSAIGLVPVVHTAHAEPFHVSNQLSSLDHGSRGRAGWLVGTESSAARARAFGEVHVTDPALLVIEASEVVDAARRLWDSWEDDAIIADESTGRFLDSDRVHYTDFRGELFSVKGPALVPRPPQGQVLVFAADRALRPGLVDVALVSGRTEPRLRAAAAAGRSAPRVVAEIEIAVDTGSATAAERLATLDARATWAQADRLRHIGSAADLVALLTRLDGLVDGVRLIPAVLDVDLPVLHREVLPALRDAGLLPAAAPGATLRDRFGLARPADRYAS